MPETINQTALYSDLDEVLNKPPKKLVRYGNVILLLVIALTIGVSFLVQHSDVVICTAFITPENNNQIKTPSCNSVVQKVFITKDTMLQKGDTLLHTKLQTAGGFVTDSFVVAPFNCWVIIRRVVENGEKLPPSTVLFDITGSQKKYTVQLQIPPGLASKVKPGMPVKFMPEKINTNCEVAYCKIISVPYTDSVSKKIVAEARVVFAQQNKTTDTAYCYILKSIAPASIITGSKSLAASLTEF